MNYLIALLAMTLFIVGCGLMISGKRFPKLFWTGLIFVSISGAVVGYAFGVANV